MPATGATMVFVAGMARSYDGSAKYRHLHLEELTMNAMTSIRISVRGALLATCISALTLPAVAAAANGAAAGAVARPSAASVAQAGSAHSTGTTMPAALRPVFYQALAKDAGSAHDINKDGCATLPKQALTACFDAGGAHFTGTTPLSLHLVAWGRSGDELATVTAVRPKLSDNEASYAHGNLTEWWRVLPVGFEQGFTITKRPSGHGELTLALAMSRQDAGAPNAGAPSLRHSRAGGNPVKNALAWGKLRYGDLVVTDANGKVVPATLKSTGDRILIAVNDTQAVYPLTVDPLVWLEQKVTASDGAVGDFFGGSVALSGATALIGASSATVNGNQFQGAAYVFSESNGSWTQTQKLTASDGAANDLFGWSVALSGATALIGTPLTNNFAGAAYVFSKSGGSWTQTAELTASDGAANDEFGSSVALAGATELIGAPNATVNGNLDQGAAYVFGESGGSWTQTTKLTASDGAASDEFGWSVAFSGATALAGAPFATVNGNQFQGAAYVFGDSGGSWTQTTKLTASDGAALDEFGWSVALSGATALAGAHWANVNGNSQQGAAYVFGDSGGSWTQTTKLTASDGAALDEFGSSVALSGATALIGAPFATVSGNSVQGAAYFNGGLANLDLLTTAPGSVSLNDTYLVQAIATNGATATSPAVAVTVTVPAAASFVSATANQGSCDESAGTVTCDFGPIGGGGVAFASVNLKATGTPLTTTENSASISHATPKLSDTAPTVILATCPPGYVTYSGTLRPNARYRTPPYQSAAGKQTVTLSAPPDFALHVGYQKNAQSQWKMRTFSRHAIYKHGPASTYKWQINAGPDGGGYTLCIQHP